jgi:hydroxymethylpyrimidine pyrophosphatase-like HAD family hydrolase
LVDKHNLNLCFINKDDYYLYKDEDKRSHLGYDPLHIPIPKKLAYTGEDIYQMNLFCEDEYVKEFIDLTGNYLSYSKLDNYGYDVYAKDQTKATGIMHLIDYLGIDKKDTFAFGDGHNDKEMIEFCEVGVAMGNAIEKVKNASNYITDDIDNDGIYNAMKYFKLI